MLALHSTHSPNGVGQDLTSDIPSTREVTHVPPGAPGDGQLASHLVAVLFAAAAPVAVTDVARVLEASVEQVEQACAFLERHPPLGLTLQQSGDQLQLVTAPSSAAAVERYFGAPPPARLSRAALEALSIIAYRQPVTRADIDAVRGVNSDSAVNTLLARGLIAEVGRRETVGRPALLGTTPEFLQYVGISSLKQLPPLPAAVQGQDEPSP